jgi:protein arginine kinase
MNLISSLRLGVETGLITDISRQALNQLMILVQPAHLQKVAGKELQSDERDVFRANFVRDYLGNKSV